MVASSSHINTRVLKAFAPSTWNQALVLLLLALGAYFQTWIDIWPYWQDQNASYSHGYLVALIAVWLVWNERETVNRIEAASDSRMLPVVVLLSSVWVVSEKANIFIVHASTWPLLAFSALWAGIGFKAASRFAFPLSYLYFAIPIWEYLMPPLQAITSAMVGLFAYLLGIPAALHGSYVTLPTGRLFITEDCSGAHFFCIALAVGALAGALRNDHWRTRILILIIAGLLSMVFNWLRILLIVLAFLHPGFKNTIGTMEGHLTLGWWVFAVDLLVFGLILRSIPRSSQSHVVERSAVPKKPVRPEDRTGLWATVAALVFLPAIAMALPRFDSFPPQTSAADFRLSLAEAEPASPDLSWRPHYPGATWETRFAVLTNSGLVVEVYGNRYHEQFQGSELVSQVSHLFDPLSFDRMTGGIVDLRDSEDRPLPARWEVHSHSAGASWLTMYTYLVDSDPVASGRRVQLITALRSMYSRATAGIIAVSIACTNNCESRISDAEDTMIRAFESYRGAFIE